MGIFCKRYRYVVAEDGLAPVWDEEHTARFHNPVSVGDEIKPRRAGEGLRRVVRVVHYLEGSVLFTVPARQRKAED
ncbi:hypothetical protein [Klebsiella sp. PL-2018]|uniref:hypothetical protein n=1 Tax=Klebsiella sp. PL-2018 TaxID=2851540 RepID=UPI001C21E48E|nr:hypothetical protein [Klebsiella sp. PL-2018]QXD01176.1 hypothetical protein MKleb_5675 [Klebsiella sp. PL-2018]